MQVTFAVEVNVAFTTQPRTTLSGNILGRNTIASPWMLQFPSCCLLYIKSVGHGGWNIPDSKVHGANMGPTLGRQDPSGPNVGHVNFAIWDVFYGVCCNKYSICYKIIIEIWSSGLLWYQETLQLDMKLRYDILKMVISRISYNLIISRSHTGMRIQIIYCIILRSDEKTL